jgi:GT2 family glycosyltransferase
VTAGGVAVHHIDLRDEGEPTSDGRPALCIFWWGDLPLGAQPVSADELPLGPATLRHLTARFAAEQRAARDASLGAPLLAGPEGAPARRLTLQSALGANGLVDWLETASARAETDAGDLSVIVCTRDRGATLDVCLAAIKAQRSPAGEVIVVDNSASGSAEAICAVHGFRYVHEPRPGLSRARNAGISAATRSLLAFTDDDVVPHPSWTAEIARAFGETGPEAITGLVLPSRLETRAQQCFQLEMGGFGSRFVPVLFERTFFEQTRHDGAHVWRIGAGANMAFRRSAFERVGLFDPRLGAGASGCSEDSELWYRILATGGACLYEPRAVVFHDHRADWDALQRQLRAYMKGHVSALVAQADRFGHRGNIARIFRQLPRYFIRTVAESVLYAQPERRRLVTYEAAGWAAGIGYLLRPRWRRDCVPKLQNLKSTPAGAHDDQQTPDRRISQPQPIRARMDGRPVLSGENACDLSDRAGIPSRRRPRAGDRRGP